MDQIVGHLDAIVLGDLSVLGKKLLDFDAVS